jgi:NADH dehydrogenase [ubiquinone] 1 alpha subcomplex assembly factor 7
VLGLWAAICWELFGRPVPVAVVEAGPGRGTLAADALRAIGRAAPGFAAALELHLIETSVRLRALQAQYLPRAIWHDRLATVEQGPFVLIANEFLDALPIRQFVRRPDGWCERHVGPDGPLEQPALAAAIAADWSDDPPGTVREIAPDARSFVEQIAARCLRHPAVALLIDYGPLESGPGDSLQAIADGRPADPFVAPGSRDLTAHVDFASLAATAREAGAAVHGPIPQGMFLARLGLPQRINRLSRSLPAAEAAAMMARGRRLIEPDTMGRMFKAMAISSADMPSCPGFDS